MILATATVISDCSNMAATILSYHAYLLTWLSVLLDMTYYLLHDCCSALDLHTLSVVNSLAVLILVLAATWVSKTVKILTGAGIRCVWTGVGDGWVMLACRHDGGVTCKHNKAVAYNNAAVTCWSWVACAEWAPNLKIILLYDVLPSRPYICVWSAYYNLDSWYYQESLSFCHLTMIGV